MKSLSPNLKFTDKKVLVLGFSCRYPEGTARSTRPPAPE